MNIIDPPLPTPADPRPVGAAKLVAALAVMQVAVNQIVDVAKSGVLLNLPPTISIGTPKLTNLTAVFTATADDVDGSVVAIDWDFADGTAGSGATVTHAFAAAGTYTVSATATDDQGLTATATRTVTVTAAASTDRSSLVPGTYKPDATTTGLLPGWTEDQLTVVNGDITVTTAGYSLKNKYVKGRVLVRATGCRISNCVIAGTSAIPSGNTAMVDGNHSAATDLVVSDSVLRPDTPNLWVDGIIGHHWTSLRNNISHTVDGLGVYNTGGAVAVASKGDWIHGLGYFTNDPNHSDGHTHNDGLQIQGAKGAASIVVLGTRIEAFADPSIGQYGSDPYRPLVTGQAIAITPNVAAITGLDITKCYLDGGANTITAILGNFAASNLGRIDQNYFGHNQNSGRVMVVTPTDTFTGTGGVYEDTAKAITIVRATS